MSNQLLIVGVNHQTAPVELRENLAPANGELPELGRRVTALQGVEEAVVLSTCNRVEIVACCSETLEEPATMHSKLAEELFRPTGLDAARFSECLFELEGREAVRHVFRVASSLDSMVVGEPQILGQLKEQFAAFEQTELSGPVLTRVFHKSFSVAKRVRTETGVASSAVSIASIATDLAKRIFETLEGRMVMLLGTGEMGELAARHLFAAGASQIMVANRTFESAVELAREFGGTPVPIDRMQSYLPLADLVVGAAGGGRVLDRQDVAKVMRERKGGPVFFIDLAVPRNFDDTINELENVYLYDIDDLSSVAQENRLDREREAVRGEAIIEDEVDRFWQWFEKLDVAPTISELRELADEIRVAELARTLPKLHATSDEDLARIDQMTRSMMKKLLHGPTVALKSPSTPAQERGMVSAVRELFGLGKRR